VFTFLSISFFHSIPSEMTLSHSLLTSSAAQSDLASRKDSTFSATWSRPFFGSSDMKSLCSIGFRNALTVPCWWWCIERSNSSTKSI